MNPIIIILSTALIVFLLTELSRPKREIEIKVHDENHSKAIHDAVNVAPGIRLERDDTSKSYPHQIYVTYESIEELMRFTQLTERNLFYSKK